MKIPQPPDRTPIQGELPLAWVQYFSQLTDYLSSIPTSHIVLKNYANDAAAALGGIPVNGFYRNGSIVMQRVV
jgi:hypothetical protein